jgi:hypothetical protein
MEIVLIYYGFSMEIVLIYYGYSMEIVLIYYGYSMEIVLIYYGFSGAIANFIIWFHYFFQCKGGVPFGANYRSCDILKKIDRATFCTEWKSALKPVCH